MIIEAFALKDKVAIITGAGRGIGKGIAIAMAEAGANIVAVARTEKEVQQVATEVSELSRIGIAYPADVTKPDDVNNMVEKVLTDFGRIDILVNNAGIGLYKPIVPVNAFKPRWSEKANADLCAPINDEDWGQIINVNLTSAFFCCRAVGPHMINQKSGKIINVSSYAGAKGYAYNIGYTTTKAGLIMFTRSLALEWARYNINVNGIGPGFVHTALTAHMFEDEHYIERLSNSIPLKRFCTPRDVGLLAVYLSSEASNYITGQTIYIDGGLLA